MPVAIRDTEVVTGSRYITNNDILNIFTGEHENPIAFLKGIGRDKRYYCEYEEENTMTMGVKAALKVLEANNLKGSDIDLIVFCSQYPEYTMPSQSLIVHNQIKGKPECVVLDMNANCLGMLRGLDVVNRYLNDKCDSNKRALLIGSDCMSQFTDKSNLVTVGSFADGACAVLLEYTEDGKGVVGSSDRTISNEAFGCMYPKHGASKTQHLDFSNNITSWTDPDVSIAIDAITEALDDVLLKHNLKATDIDWFCGSQFAKPFLYTMAENCNIPKEKVIYIGDQYGYTGTSSPFIAINEGLKDGRIKKGDLVFISTVGVGASICSMLVRF